jgi:hypothetical protein
MNNLLKKYYPLADEPSPEELYNLEVSDKVGVRAMATGEMRAPRKGEWFLSGAVVEAYRANNDISIQYNIAKLVVV